MKSIPGSFQLWYQLVVYTVKQSTDALLQNIFEFTMVSSTGASKPRYRWSNNHKNLLDMLPKVHQSLLPWPGNHELPKSGSEKGPNNKGNKIQLALRPTITQFQRLIRSASLPCSGQPWPLTGRVAVFHVEPAANNLVEWHANIQLFMLFCLDCFCSCFLNISLNKLFP